MWLITDWSLGWFGFPKFGSVYLDLMVPFFILVSSHCDRSMCNGVCMLTTLPWIAESLKRDR